MRNGEQGSAGRRRAGQAELEAALAWVHHGMDRGKDPSWVVYPLWQLREACEKLLGGMRSTVVDPKLTVMPSTKPEDSPEPEPHSGVELRLAASTSRPESVQFRREPTEPIQLPT